MDDEITFDELETRQAAAAGTLLRTMLQAACIRRPYRAESLKALTAARLVITAVGPQVQLQFFAEIDGNSELLYGATFQEDGVLH